MTLRRSVYLTRRLGHISLKYREAVKIVHPKLNVKTNSPAALSDSAPLLIAFSHDEVSKLFKAVLARSLRGIEKRNASPPGHTPRQLWPT